jgi:hypothetical protein
MGRHAVSGWCLAIRRIEMAKNKNWAPVAWLVGIGGMIGYEIWTPSQKPSGTMDNTPSSDLPLASSSDTSSGSGESAAPVEELPKFYSEKEEVSPTIILGYHTTGSVESSFAISVAKAVRYCGSFISHVYPWEGPYVVEGRNRLLDHLVQSKKHAMLMLDADIEFLPENILKTWAVASLTGADIVWGNYALGDFRNSLFQPATEEMQEQGLVIPGVMFDLQPNMIIEGVVAGGTGWLYVTRTAAEKMKEAYKDDPWPWFNRDIMQLREGDINLWSLANEKREVRSGEDITFGLRAWKLGLVQVGYTGLVNAHIKKKKTAPAFMQPYIAAHGLGDDLLYGKSVPAEKKETSNESAEGDICSADSAGETNGCADVGPEERPLEQDEHTSDQG